MTDIDSTELANVTVYMQKIFGFPFDDAEILARLYLFAKQYEVNLSLLIPVLEGIITLKSNHATGRVIVHTGYRTNKERTYSVELRRTISELSESIDETK